MVVMQFDASLALHELGKSASALAALQAAIDLDREYGFKDDAAENYRQLLAWRGQPSGTQQIVPLMQDFPRRQASMKFAWHSGTAHITFETRRVLLEDDQIIASRATASFERHIDSIPAGGWAVSYQHRLAQYQPGVWPTLAGSQIPSTWFPRPRFRPASS
jgi:hypothetical protein